MNQQLQDRLNQIPDKILSEEFLKSQGLGNELGFWIFDYAPEDELQVREYLSFLQGFLAKKHSQLKVAHVSLLQAMREYLDQRSFTEKAIQMQQTKGDLALLKALSGPLHMDKFAPFLMELSGTDQHDVVLISGVGSVWPVLRAHNLLNKLHALLGHKPLVLFYPGHYSGQSLALFDRIPSNNYYRAFKLIP
ncbi:DUF1788 domain-containing protein [Pseudomonas putida]|uniref:DUF1788 domain-containing protein n=1 Tax=Pseudomonas putida TaxID=303 RepID=UPI00236439A5|nr:DUF1788 domain-containing protein [Pseudomonas putida]MDD2015126.1 DUF1788 domain-containing protein [Pseudomonas putida]HDS1772216.1 DUF1788 domain-containing protein [Pseudomonas putida]